MREREQVRIRGSFLENMICVLCLEDWWVWGKQRRALQAGGNRRWPHGCRRVVVTIMGGGHLIRLEPGWWWTLTVGVWLARGNNGSLSQRVHYILGTFSNRNHVSDPFYLLCGRIVFGKPNA